MVGSLLGIIAKYCIQKENRFLKPTHFQIEFTNEQNSDILILHMNGNNSIGTGHPIDVHGKVMAYQYSYQESSHNDIPRHQICSEVKVGLSGIICGEKPSRKCACHSDACKHP